MLTMASRKTRRRNLIQIAALIAAVAVVVAGSIAFQTWWNKRPEKEPRDIAIEFSSPTASQEVFPFSICEPGVECPENSVPVITMSADQELTVKVPPQVSDHDWSLLKIYDDPAANDQSFYAAHDANEIKVSGSASLKKDAQSLAKLVVVEVSSVLIGHDDKGDETPYTVTWSVHVTVT